MSSEEEHSSPTGGESPKQQGGADAGAKRGRGRPAKKGGEVGVAAASRAIKKPATAATRTSARNTNAKPADKPKSAPVPPPEEAESAEEAEVAAPAAPKGRGRAPKAAPAAKAAAPSAGASSSKGRGRPKK